MAKVNVVYPTGTIEVDGKTYLPGEPFAMEENVVRHCNRHGLTLLPAEYVKDDFRQAIQRNTMVLNPAVAETAGEVPVFPAEDPFVSDVVTAAAAAEEADAKTKTKKT